MRDGPSPETGRAVKGQMSRALRRHHRLRVVARARRIFRRRLRTYEGLLVGFGWWESLPPDHSKPDALAVHLADHLQHRSDRGRGNPRRDPWTYGEETRQERLAALELREVLADLGL